MFYIFSSLFNLKSNLLKKKKQVLFNVSFELKILIYNKNQIAVKNPH